MSTTTAHRTTDQPATARRRGPYLALECLFGAAGLVLAGLTALFVSRGLLYGLVDDGPYTDAWGGPSLAGAWAVHAAVGLGVMVVVAAAARGVLELHRRATAWRHGADLPRWFTPTVTAGCIVIAVFLVAFVRQL